MISFFIPICHRKGIPSSITPFLVGDIYVCGVKETIRLFSLPSAPSSSELVSIFMELSGKKAGWIEIGGTRTSHASWVHSASLNDMTLIPDSFWSLYGV